jgi:glucosamine--fructose-6-phosphate aminotransferase (isomerizing)
MSATVPQRTDSLRTRLEATLAWSEASAGGRAIGGALAVARAAPDSIVESLASASRIVLCGAGSSYYVAQIVAAAMREVAGLAASAVPLSEAILRPEGVLSRDPRQELVVIISRSGATTEALTLVRRLDAGGWRTLAITCRGAGPLAAAAPHAIVVPADEQAIVMTRSVGAMTVGLLRLVARVASDGQPLADDLDRLPDAWPDALALVDPALALADAAPGRVVVLGGGAALGLANEAVLKITETSQVPANAWEPFEFRHGPISVCEPGVLVVGLLGGASAATEQRVLDEAAELGATTWSPDPGGVGAQLGPIARLTLMLYPLQALAFGLALRHGLDPDRPRHLNQVVVLDDA